LSVEVMTAQCGCGISKVSFWLNPSVVIRVGHSVAISADGQTIVSGGETAQCGCGISKVSFWLNPSVVIRVGHVCRH
jgi:hypothetical protein